MPPARAHRGTRGSMDVCQLLDRECAFFIVCKNSVVANICHGKAKSKRIGERCQDVYLTSMSLCLRNCSSGFED